MFHVSTKEKKNIKCKGTIYDFYFVSKKGSAPPYYSDPWYNHIIDFTDLARLILNYKKSYSTKNTSEWSYDITNTTLAIIDDNNDDTTKFTSITTSNNKKQKGNDTIQYLNDNDPEKDESVLAQLITTIAPQQEIVVLPPQPLLSYWQSTEARKIFMPLDNETDSYVAVKAQIEILSDAMETPLGLVSILEDGDQIDLESISPYQMFYLKQKVTMLHIALNIAVKNMLDIQNWSACCEKAIEVAKDTIGKGGIKSKEPFKIGTCNFERTESYAHVPL